MLKNLNVTYFVMRTVPKKKPIRRSTHLSLYRKHANTYGRLDRTGTFFPLFTNLRHLIKNHVSGRRALDFGCGSGRSTVFLKELGFDAVGVDISRDQIELAHKKDPRGKYVHITSKAKLRRQVSRNFDLVLSNITFPEFPTGKHMVRALQNIKEILSPDGKIIIATVTPEGYQNNWASYTGAFPENRGKLSGEKVRLVVAGTNMEFHDYLWRPEDFRQAFRAAGLRIVNESRPLGKKSEKQPYVTETKKPFWHIYVLVPFKK